MRNLTPSNKPKKVILYMNERRDVISEAYKYCLRYLGFWVKASNPTGEETTDIVKLSLDINHPDYYLKNVGWMKIDENTLKVIDVISERELDENIEIERQKAIYSKKYERKINFDDSDC